MRCCRTTILSAVLLAGVTTALSQPAASSLHLDLHSRETINITAWGANSLRVRVAVPGNQISDSVPGALIEPGSDNKGAPLAPPTAITVKYFECQLDASDCTAATISAYSTSTTCIDPVPCPRARQVSATWVHCNATQCNQTLTRTSPSALKIIIKQTPQPTAM